MRDYDSNSYLTIEHNNLQIYILRDFALNNAMNEKYLLSVSRDVFSLFDYPGLCYVTAVSTVKNQTDIYLGFKIF